MRIKKIIKFACNELIYGGHIQSLGAVSIVFVSAILLRVRISWDILFIIYLMFYSFYLYNHFKEINVDYLTNPQRTQHLITYKKFIPLIFYFTILIIFSGLIYFSNLWSLIFSLLLFIFGILYTTVFKKLTKKIAFLKNIYVSVFFALLPFYLLIYYSYPLKYFLTSAVLVLLFIFLKMFLIQIFLDIKDIESDKKEGLITFPIIFGREKTLKIALIANTLITIIIPIFFSLYLNIFPRIALMIIFTVPLLFYCYDLAKKQKYLAYILQSGEFILWLILIIIGKIIL